MDSPCAAMKCWCPYKREQSYSGHTFSHSCKWHSALANDSLFSGKRRQHCQATSLMSDLDEVNFPETVLNCLSTFWYRLNNIGVI
jgi:hypothetical protein